MCVCVFNMHMLVSFFHVVVVVVILTLERVFVL